MLVALVNTLVSSGFVDRAALHPIFFGPNTRDFFVFSICLVTSVMAAVQGDALAIFCAGYLCCCMCMREFLAITVGVGAH
jgi:hypothetical protein